MFEQHPNLIALRGCLVAVCLAVLGGCGSAGGVSAANKAPDSVPAAPATPSGLKATAGNATVALSWAASSGATGYNVKRGTVRGGPYTQSGSISPTRTPQQLAAILYDSRIPRLIRRGHCRRANGHRPHRNRSSVKTRG